MDGYVKNAHGLMGPPENAAIYRYAIVCTFCFSLVTDRWADDYKPPDSRTPKHKATDGKKIKAESMHNQIPFPTKGKTSHKPSVRMSIGTVSDNHKAWDIFDWKSLDYSEAFTRNSKRIFHIRLEFICGYSVLSSRIQIVTFRLVWTNGNYNFLKQGYIF